MAHSDFIKEMVRLEDRICSTGTVESFARALTEVDDVFGEISGFIFLLEERGRLFRISNMFGELALYRGVTMLDDSPEEVEKYDEEERGIRERMVIIKRFADIIKRFDIDSASWTPEIKVRFEKGLAYLEDLVRGDPTRSAEEEGEPVRK